MNHHRYDPGLIPTRTLNRWWSATILWVLSIFGAVILAACTPGSDATQAELDAYERKKAARIEAARAAEQAIIEFKKRSDVNLVDLTPEQRRILDGLCIAVPIAAAGVGYTISEEVGAICAIAAAVDDPEASG